MKERYFSWHPISVFTIESEKGEKLKPFGWIILIHPVFIWNTALAKTIKQYEFFGYTVNEALYLSEKEEKKIVSLIKNIQQVKHGIKNIKKSPQREFFAVFCLFPTTSRHSKKKSERFYPKCLIKMNVNNFPGI